MYESVYVCVRVHSFLYLVYDGLHVRLVFVVSVEKRGPLLWTDPQTSLHSHSNDLAIVFTT